MRATITPGGTVRGTATVPGDKSISHRWVILAATARGRSRLRGLPRSLDVRSTARVVGALAPQGSEGLRRWEARSDEEGSTGAPRVDGPQSAVDVEGWGREALVQASAALDCGNS